MKPQHKKIYLIGPLLDQMDSIHIESADLVIFIDAAISYRDRVHFTCKSISLGDGDGIPWDKGDFKKNDKESYKGSYKERLDILAPTEKDESDFKLALNHLETHLPHLASIEITAIGLWGGRLDHQISIFGEFINFLKDEAVIAHFSMFGIDVGDREFVVSWLLVREPGFLVPGPILQG